MRSRTRAGLGFASLWFAVCASCDRHAGSAQIDFEWRGGAPPYDGRWYAFVELRDEKSAEVLGRSDPRALDGEALIDLPRVPTGRRMIVLAEVRPSAWRNDRVHYRGASAPFAAGIGEHLALTAVLEALPEPAPTGEGPAAPDAARARFDRAPWGTRDSGGRPSYRVEGAAAANAAVVIFDRAEAAEAEILGRATAGGDGQFRAELFGAALSTLSRVYAAVEDAEGNLSDASDAPGLQATAVEGARWTATMLGKIPGENYPNPHRLLRVARLEATRDQPPELSVETSNEDLRALATEGSGGVRSEASLFWEPLESSATPPARAGAVMTFDRVRGRAQLFGGFAPTGRRRDLWEWDGRTWTERAPSANGPAQRDDLAGAYMSRLERTVIFGGATLASNAGHIDELWSFDGRLGRWSMPVIENSRPSARAEHAIAYDDRRGRLLLFGGKNSAGERQNDLWSWDGRAWTEVIVDGERPSPRTTRIAYDSARDRLVLFGGVSNDVAQNDTWEWDGTSWTELHPEHRPEPIAGHGMVYDEARRQVVLFGGIVPGLFTSDTWSWDGVDWTRRTPQHRPRGRTSHAIAYDAARRRVIVFGGYTLEVQPFDTLLGDTWEWDGEDWVERNPAAIAPSARYMHTLAFDDTSRRTVLFGGAIEGDRISDETWTFDDSGWRKIVKQGAWPEPRYYSTMAFDPPSGKMLLYGGVGGAGIDELDESWTFDGRFWRQLDEPTPSARAASPMIYQPARGAMLLFGGGGLGGMVLGDTWERREDGWSQRAPEGDAPPSRFGHMLAWDPGASEAVLFSGNRTNTIFAGQTWTFDGDAWTERSDGVQPEDRAGGQLVGVDALDGAVLFGGSTGADADRTGLWLWSAHRWRKLTALGRPPNSREIAGLAYDAHRRRLVLFGGNNGNYQNRRLLDDTWTIDVDGERRGGLIAELDVRAAGLGEAAFASIEVRIVAGGTGGVLLSAWDAVGGRWAPLAEGEAELDAPATLIARSDAARLISEDESPIALRLEPRGGPRLEARVALEDLAVTLERAP